MSMFSSLSENISKVFDKLKRKGTITEEDINQVAREVRVALLEADVSLPVIKQIVEQLKEKAIGEQVIKSVTPAQQLIKILNDLLVEILSSEDNEINLNAKPPVVIMLVGVQGAGKTTTAAKLAYYLKTKKNKRVLLASTDIYRPAAKEQLATVAKLAEVDCLDIIGDENPVTTSKRALKQAHNGGYEILIVDTAGRLHTNEELMQEIQDIESTISPTETLLVADSMTGQDALRIAEEFSKVIKLTGIILTRVDGDARGGAMLSMKVTTGCPIKFVGIGEKFTEFDQFYPDRIASRILGMGDVVSLVEKAASAINQNDAERMASRIMRGKFDMNDLAAQLGNIKKMGGVGSIFNMLPGMGMLKEKMKGQQVNEKVFDYQLAIIRSMTKQERFNPDILNGKRRKRIADGSGRTIQEVNKLMDQYRQMQGMVKKFKGLDLNNMKDMGPLKNMFGKFFS